MKYELGVQSFTYRQFSLQEMCAELATAGVRAVELCGVHISPDSSQKSLIGARELLSEHNIAVCGYGVTHMSDTNEVEKTLNFVKELGASYASISFDPQKYEVLDKLLQVADELNLLLAIHNHGPQDTFSTVEDVLEVTKGLSERLGACVDTGHYFRSGQSPLDVIPRLGPRVHAVHVKDFIDSDTEAVPGTGQLDLAELVQLLARHSNFSNPLVLEYEADPGDPTPAVKETLRLLRQAMG